jgi:N-acetylglucosamine kinase-like BadF-type ATPase
MVKSGEMCLAVDSGATRARYVLRGSGGDGLANGEVAGANYNSSGARALATLFEALGERVSSFGTLAHIGLAMAGVGRPDVRARACRDIQPLLHRFFPGAGLYLFHDAEAALWAVLEGSPGVVVAVGTGSVATAAREPGRDITRCGGWGHLAGDEGSGYWIAIEALRQVFRSLDGRGAEPVFTKAVCEVAGVDEPLALVDWVELPERRPSEIANLAPCLDGPAEGGDPLAREILEQAGILLGELAIHLIRRCELGRNASVGMTGSILLRSKTVSQSFRRSVQSVLPGAVFTTPRITQAEGVALMLMNRLGREESPDVSPERVV